VEDGSDETVPTRMSTPAARFSAVAERAVRIAPRRHYDPQRRASGRGATDVRRAPLRPAEPGWLREISERRFSAAIALL
jgi:hypothetical protein